MAHPLSVADIGTQSKMFRDDLETPAPMESAP